MDRIDPRPRRPPPGRWSLDSYPARERFNQEDERSYWEQRDQFYRDSQDPRWHRPIEVPPPYCRRHGECDEIGRRTW
jgi:hypothetical protein